MILLLLYFLHTMYVNMIIMLSGFTANVYALQLLLIYALRLEYSLPSVFCRC